MNIGGFQKFSLIDYPGKISAVIFTQGCNFRCPYCHNPELFETKSELINEKEVLDFLESRKKQLEAVVITGGEPTLQLDLINFLEKVNKLGFLIKLDTNGTSPQIIQKALELNLVDYVAMDIKGPIDKYEEIAGVKVNTMDIVKSIKLIMEKALDYEFRTTITREQLKKEDIKEIGRLINGAKKYYLQKYICRVENKKMADVFTAYDEKEMEKLKKETEGYFDQCLTR